MASSVPNKSKPGDDDAAEDTKSTISDKGAVPSQPHQPNAPHGKTPAKDKGNRGDRKQQQPPGTQKMPNL